MSNQRNIYYILEINHYESDVDDKIKEILEPFKNNIVVENKTLKTSKSADYLIYGNSTACSIVGQLVKSRILKSKSYKL